jgi:hypothetical protein
MFYPKWTLILNHRLNMKTCMWLYCTNKCPYFKWVDFWNCNTWISFLIIVSYVLFEVSQYALYKIMKNSKINSFWKIFCKALVMNILMVKIEFFLEVNIILKIKNYIELCKSAQNSMNRWAQIYMEKNWNWWICCYLITSSS